MIQLFYLSLEEAFQIEGIIFLPFKSLIFWDNAYIVLNILLTKYGLIWLIYIICLVCNQEFVYELNMVSVSYIPVDIPCFRYTDL